jgi:hypothetical protein
MGGLAGIGSATKEIQPRISRITRMETLSLVIRAIREIRGFYRLRLAAQGSFAAISTAFLRDQRTGSPAPGGSGPMTMKRVA